MTYPDESSPSRRARRLLRGAAREPLVHFVLLAAIPFALHAAGDEPLDRREPIVLSEGFLEELVEQKAARGGGDPESIDRDALAEGFRREEALYREARRLGLDRGDPIVRRRLVQKMRFLLESRVEVPEPDDETLSGFIAQHPLRFRRPAQLSFDQVFFDGSDAEARARATLDELGPTAAPELVTGRSDPFPLGTSHGPLSVDRVEARLGPALAAAVDEAPTNRWVGPVRSEWGVHLVRVRERTEASAPPLEAVRESARRAWVAARREEALERSVQELVGRWPLRREGDSG